MINMRARALALALLSCSVVEAAPQLAQAQAFLNVRIEVAPPPLPVYVQPPLPGPDYIWAPGYWSWDADYGDYYWVPGTWVIAPRPGLLWTPSWWGWENGLYLFHTGYWGPHIGYYGGVNYGFGYTGSGFEGGYWSGPHFFYNRAVNNVTNVNIANVYEKTVIVNRITVNNVSYSGGPGGVVAHPTPQQIAAGNESHVQPTAMQVRHVQAAQNNRALFASANHGAPPVAASARPAQFSGSGVVRAQGAGAAPTVGGRPTGGLKDPSVQPPFERTPDGPAEPGSHRSFDGSYPAHAQQIPPVSPQGGTSRVALERPPIPPAAKTPSLQASAPHAPAPQAHSTPPRPQATRPPPPPKDKDDHGHEH